MSQVQQLRRERNINTQQFTLLKVNTAKANTMLDDGLKWAQIAYMKMLFWVVVFTLESCISHRLKKNAIS